MRLFKGKLYKCVHEYPSPYYERNYIIFSPLEDTIVNNTIFNLEKFPSVTARHGYTVLCSFLVGFDGKISSRKPLETGIYEDCHFVEIGLTERNEINEKKKTKKDKFKYNPIKNRIEVL